MLVMIFNGLLFKQQKTQIFTKGTNEDFLCSFEFSVVKKITHAVHPTSDFILQATLTGFHPSLSDYKHPHRTYYDTMS